MSLGARPAHGERLPAADKPDPVPPPSRHRVPLRWELGWKTHTEPEGNSVSGDTRGEENPAEPG